MPKKGQVTDPAVRFWRHVQKSDGCWLWVGGKIKAGYGDFHPTHSKHVLAHRFAWELANGPIPKGLQVLHGCDNPPCVRVGPGHLFLGTQSDNIRDCVKKGRLVDNRGEKQGASKLTDSKVLSIRDLYSRGGITKLSLGQLFNVNRRTIGMIVRRKTWKHLP